MLEIEVCEIKGKWPVHELGDKIMIDDPKIVSKKTDALCAHSCDGQKLEEEGS